MISITTNYKYYYYYY